MASNKKFTFAYKLIYNGLLFPTVLGFYIPVFLIFFTLPSASPADDSFMADVFRSILVLTVSWIFSLILFKELTNFFMNKQIDIDTKESTKK